MQDRSTRRRNRRLRLEVVREMPQWVKLEWVRSPAKASEHNRLRW